MTAWPGFGGKPEDVVKHEQAPSGDDVNGVASHRRQLVFILKRAALHLRVEVVGDLRFGWRDRTVGVRVTNEYGDAMWLRVVGEPADHPSEIFWDGNQTATTLLGPIRRPEVRQVVDYAEPDYRFRAELATLVAEPACSRTPVATTMPTVDDGWWSLLRTWLANLEQVNTDRLAVTPEQLARRLHSWDTDLPVDVARWLPAHADLHWANLTAPGCWLLDWEGWGLAPAGFDAASLYMHSMGVPKLAEQVQSVFAEALGTRDGVLAQLYVASRMKSRGDLDGPATPPAAARSVLGHVDSLLQALDASDGGLDA